MAKDFTPESVIHPAGEDDEFILIVGKNDKGKTRNKSITSVELGAKLREQHDERAAAAEQHQENTVAAKEILDAAKEVFDTAVKTSQEEYERTAAEIDAKIKVIHADAIAQLEEEMATAEAEEEERLAKAAEVE